MKKSRFVTLILLSALAILTIFTDAIPQKTVFLVSLLSFAALLYVPPIFKHIFPDFLSTDLRLNLAFILQYSIIVFIALALVLGTAFRFYEDFIWWDLFLHFLAGIIFAAPGYCILFKGVKNAKRYIAFLVPFCFSMTASALWEIYEFAGDMIFGMTMQGNGISDTMEDLTACFVAAILTSLGFYFLTKKYNK